MATAATIAIRIAQVGSRSTPVAAAPQARRDADALAWRVAVALAATAFLARGLFWAATGRIWEDALITVLHSENFGRGLGLTHVRLGEPPIHGFTSPISVLVPLLADAFRPGWGIILIRLVSMLAGSAAVLLVFALNRATPSLRLPLPLVTMAAGYVAIEHHQMLWGMAGMETQLVTLILLAALWASAVALPPAAIGLAMAAALYARPDYLPLAGLLAAVEVVRGIATRSARRPAIAIAVALAAYAPWLLFTTLYYGSPVPNTVLAKAGGYRLWIHEPQTWASAIGTIVERTFVSVLGPQTPAFGGNGTGFHSLLGQGPAAWLPSVLAGFMIVRGAAAAVVRRQWDAAPLYLFLFGYLVYYVFLVPVVFGWYTVPVNALAALLAAKGLRDFLRVQAARPALWAATALYLGAFAAALVVTIPAERRIQRLVEDPVRKRIGLDLAAKGDPSLTVAAEPLGYIGYYSGLTDYDFPGLASRRVVALLAAHPGAGLGGMMAGLRPDYLVLRPHEIATIRRRADRGDWLDRSYVLERRYAVSPADRGRLLFPGDNIDTDFRLYRRID